jgi:hypothetical protein
MKEPYKKVKIIGCSYKGLWYKDMIGKTIDVFKDPPSPNFYMARSGKHILIVDTKGI